MSIQLVDNNKKERNDNLTYGTIFSIEEFSIYDGPGIRTTVFLKGCPLRCTWCHNPEGQEFEACIVRSPNGCIGCNSCVNSAIYKNNKIVFSDESVKKCPMNLLRYCGETLNGEELALRLMKNQRILSDGGITFSGGEPLAQSEFLIDVLARLKGKLHTAVQTSGYCDEKIFDKVLEYSDYFLYDIKIADSEFHKKYTGVRNECILRNLNTLAHSGKEFVVRIPLIPGVTDTEENITSIANILVKNKIFYAELLPYNKMAGGKYKMLMQEYTPNFNTEITPEIHNDIFKKHEIDIKVL